MGRIPGIILTGLRASQRRAASAAARGTARPPLRPVDVWSWTAPKYRVRTVVLLMINALLFAGLGCFAYWLRTGSYAPFLQADYWRQWREVFDPTQDRQVTLIDFLMYPIPVDQVPMMIVIMGLVLATLTAIPILVAMLYRFPSSLIFTGIIAFVALLPWLGITVTICCLLASRRRLRFSFGYATALLALLPVVLYYALATQNATTSPHLRPVEVATLYIPWIIALIGACTLMGVVLTIARLVNYRPGAIAPLMATMFALPVILFESRVGRDELYYRLLEYHYGPGSSTHFVDDVDASGTIERIAAARLARTRNPRASLESVREQVRIELQLQLASVQAERDAVRRSFTEAFATHQHRAIAACDDFIRGYPASRYVPNALYIKGQCLDTRVDQELFRRKAMLRHYRDFPNAASLPVWKALHENYPDSPLWTTATYKLALLTARSPEAGSVDQAVRLLEELIARRGTLSAEPAGQAGLQERSGLWGRLPASTKLDVDPAAVVLEGAKLRELLVRNRDPQQDDLPLKRLLRLDPRHALYRRNLDQLLADIPVHHPLTPLRDNVEVLIAAAQPSLSLRIDHLSAAVRRLAADPRSDALPVAQLELAAAYQSDNRPEEAWALLQEIQKSWPQSPWAQEAARRMALMAAPSRSAAGHR